MRRVFHALARLIRNTGEIRNDQPGSHLLTEQVLRMLDTVYRVAT